MLKQRIILFIYFFIYVSISFYFSPFLVQEKGFALETMGYLTTIGLSLLIISYFISGIIADKINSNKTIILLNLIISFFVFICLLLFDSKTILAILYILSWTSFIVLTSIIDGLVLNTVDVSKYSSIRAYGSIGAAVSYFLSSYALDVIGFENLILLDSILIFALFAIVFTVDEKFASTKIEAKNYLDAAKYAISKKELLLILLITFLTYGTLSADDSYQVIYNSTVVNMSAALIGFVGFLSIISESSFMNLHKFFEKRIGLTNILYIAAGTLFVIYFTRAYLYDFKMIIVIGNIMLGLFIGFFIPSAITIISNNSPHEIRSTMLSIYQIMIRFGGVLIGLITAIYFDVTGSLSGIYQLHTIIILISFIFIFILGKSFTTNKNIK